jgi:2-desacetyl-2-hydroxyethyl bacteriochlorophyllide A dehydrogenase
MGHEMMGEIVEASANESVHQGDRVVIDPALSCGKCDLCKTRHAHLCLAGGLIGRDANGGFAEYIAVPARQVFRLPESIDDHSAALIQVLTTCVHAQNLAAIHAGESVVVLGLGTTGQLHIQIAKAQGAQPVIGITRSPEKRKLAETFKADLTLPNDQDAVEKVREVTRGLGADVVIETSGSASCLKDAVAMVRPGGRILLFGIFTAPRVELPLYDVYFKELTWIGARAATNEDFPAAIRLVEQGAVQLAPLISAVLPLADLGAAVEKLAHNRGQSMRIVLQN